MKQLALFVLALICLNSVHAQDYKFKKISKQELEQKEHPLEKDAAAAVLYRNTYTSFDYSQDDGFVAETVVHERTKIYKQEGYKYATISIPMYISSSSSREEVSGLKAFSYNLKDGKVVESKLQGKNIFKEESGKTRNLIKFTMPDINDGTVIEYKYTFISPFISSIDEFEFQEEIPVDKVEMLFLAPEYMVYNPYGKGVIALGMETEKRARSINYRYERAALAQANDVERGNATLEFQENGYRVSLSNIPALKNEPFSTNQNNYKSGLQFELAYTKYPNSGVKEYATTWEDVAREIFKSSQFGEELARKKYFKSDIDALIQGVTDPQEKLIKVFEFVKQKMNWNEYYGVYTDLGVRDAYKEGVGNVADINLMLNAMLNYAGLETSPVLLSTKANGISFFPTRSGFNYVIAGAKIKEQMYLLDAVDKEGVINTLKPELLNWKGRMVKEDGSSRLIEVYPSKPAVHNSLINYSFNEEGQIEGNSKNRFSAHYAKGYRSRYLEATEDEQLTRLSSTYEDIDIVDHSFKDLKNVQKNLTLEYNFEAEDAMEEIGGKMYLSPLLHLATKTNYFEAETRSAPIDFVHPWSDRFIVNIEIPEGYELESKPDDIAINLTDNIGSYRFSVNQLGNTLTVSLQNTINTPVIPATFYKDLQAYFKLIVDKETEKIVFKKM